MIEIAGILLVLALTIGGYGWLTHRRWGLHLALACVGVTLYCWVCSTGILVQEAVAVAGMFAVLATVTMAFIGNLVPA